MISSMLRLIKYIAPVMIIFVNIDYCHGIHISYVEISLSEYRAQGKVTFYKDDFMLALKKAGGGSFEHYSKEDYDKLKLRYLRDHYSLSVNNKKLQLQVTGSSEDENTIWFEFKFISEDKIEILEIINYLLITEFSDQMNILNLRTAAGDQSIIFNKSKYSIKIKI